MPGTIFVNLPVADAAASTRFYEALGMVRDERFSDANASAMVFADTITFMLLRRDFYATFTPKRIIDAKSETGALIALGLDSRAEVDAMAEAALAAGGRELHDPEDHGFMYSRAFEDLDGHGFSPLAMDMAAFMAAKREPQGA